MSAVLASTENGDAGISPEFCLNVGGPTRADEAAHVVVTLRLEGATWDEICVATGLSRNVARECFRRHTQDQAPKGAETDAVNKIQPDDELPEADVA